GLAGELVLDTDGRVRAALIGAGHASFTPPDVGGALDDFASVLTAIAHDRAEATIRASFEVAPSAQPRATLGCKFVGVGPTIDLLAVAERLAHGRTAPAQAAQPSGVDCTERFPVGFRLDEIAFELSRTPWFAIAVKATLGRAELAAYFRLSSRDATIGLGGFRPEEPALLVLPLSIPHVRADELRPFARPYLDRLRTAAARSRYQTWVELFLAGAEAVTGAFADTAGLVRAHFDAAAGVWRVALRDPTVQLDDVPFRIAGGTTDDTEELVIACQIDNGAWIPLVVKPCLELDGIAITVPFTGGRGVSASGTARLGGFVGLSFVEGVGLTLGISSEMVYFALDVRRGTRFVIPPILPGYDPGSISIAKLMFGFGWAKRSLAIAFDGELVVPRQLVDDLDVSELGAGVRIPVQSRLAFQFDLIPLILGNLVIPCPMLAFNLDLRQDALAGIGALRGCEPVWDGLQVVVPGIVRISLKHVSYSYIFGLMAASNSDLDGDIAIGTAATGATLVIDDMFWIYGQDSWTANLAAPILTIPFFEHVCLSLRLGGFGVNVDLQRPVPAFSPLALFELLALLADPENYEVAPRGALADMIRATITEAFITLPAEVLGLFPAAEPLVRKQLDATLNLGTVIRLAQALSRALRPIAEALVRGVRDGLTREALQRQLAAIAAALDPAAVARDALAALPPELRKLRLSAQFGPFDASALLVIADDPTIRTAIRRRGQPPDATPLSELTRGTVWNADEMDRFRPPLRALPGAPRMLDPARPGAELLVGLELDWVTEDDLDDLAPPPSGALLAVEDVRPGLADWLGRAVAPGPTRRLASWLRDQLSPRTLQLLGERADAGADAGPLDPRLVRALVGDLNAILQGDLIYSRLRFRTVHLPRRVRRLLDQALASPAPITPQDRTQLNRLLLEAARPDAVAPGLGILVGARLRLSGSQRYRFVGQLFADGSFGLISALDVAPLRLAVRGLPPVMTLAMRTRLTLSGRARRDGATAVIRGEAILSWQPIPGLLRIDAGTKLSPVVVELADRHRFRVTGQVLARLFGDAVQFDGRLDATETHAVIDGRLGYSAGPIGLAAELHGALGPGPRFELIGTGAVSLFGVRFGGASVRVDERGADVAVHVVHDGWWIPQGQRELPGRADLQLSGRIDLAKQVRARFALAGEGSLEIADLGLRIRGRAGVSADAGRVTTFLEGALHLWGRDWVTGRVELATDRVAVEGRVRLGFEHVLPATGASVLLEVDVDGRFEFDAKLALAHASLGASWLVGIRLAAQEGFGPERRGVVPIATHAIPRQSFSGGFDIKLVDLANLRLPPLGDLPLPHVDIATSNFALDIKVWSEWPHVTVFRGWGWDDFIPGDWRQLVTGTRVGDTSYTGGGLMTFPHTGTFPVHLVWDAETGRPTARFTP
ncbi:MAG TPA: hypothetical protein VGD80_33305, partial [Kofleriaceae bacterium]